ncbi:hypothetical protein IQ270_22490 [Microcoleus sp. LEGE 07076]|uniref:hypothetical protein n=1 Tax=Microcoleus sp. LEGE 07076 TaxID=915322 RepID=UPI00187DEBB8|nr:hypothetical protein [Microcoleus sp. LEGE 07076]MBE9187345.1 hypothetical protein [Microcoleus sp. LEGE 07076]
MSIFPNFLRSVLLTGLLSFVAPLLLIGAGLTGCSLIGLVPALQGIGHSGEHLILQFLATFGSGCPLQGFLVIGLTFGLVGALFDTYAAYQHSRWG